MQCNEISELTTVLRENGDKILDASSKLSLSTTLISKMNTSFNCMIDRADNYTSPFHVLSSSTSLIDQFLDLQLLYDFIQKTVALKILPDSDALNAHFVDINIFRNLKFLEVHRISLNLITGLCSLRSHLEHLICKRSVNTLKDALELCGADKTSGFVWSELKRAIFSYNDLDKLDTSLEFTPWLHTIDLSHNHIHDAHSINCLPNLKYLNLSFNAIETIPAFNGQLCNKLQVLILRNNYIDNIKELSLLVNLCELDLSHNCLIEHGCLTPLINLSILQKLQLQGNPLSYHPKHRKYTAKYLHINTLSANFLLEKSYLSKSESSLVGTLHPMHISLELSSSTNSATTANTVVRNDTSNELTPTASNVISILETETSDISNYNFEAEEVVWLRNEINTQDGQGMQDSGFVAEQRPASPSECSIESTAHCDSISAQILVVAEVHKANNKPRSATSMDDKKLSEQTIRYCESDIEVLSNPSQSSIEVLSNRSIPRYVQSSSAILTQTFSEISTNNDLKKSIEEMHRSL